jgi:hypothetical protein
VGLVVLREGLRGGGLVHRVVVPQQGAHICGRTPTPTPRHAFEQSQDTEPDCLWRRRIRGKGRGAGGLPLAT